MKKQQRRLEKLLAVLEENQHIHIKRLEELMETSTSTLRRVDRIGKIRYDSADIWLCDALEEK